LGGDVVELYKNLHGSERHAVKKSFFIYRKQFVKKFLKLREFTGLESFASCYIDPFKNLFTRDRMPLHKASEYKEFLVSPYDNEAIRSFNETFYRK
jgi:hypothetical protein